MKCAIHVEKLIPLPFVRDLFDILQMDHIWGSAAYRHSPYSPHFFLTSPPKYEWQKEKEAMCQQSGDI